MVTITGTDMHPDEFLAVIGYFPGASPVNTPVELYVVPLLLKVRPAFEEVTFIVPVATLQVDWVMFNVGANGNAFGAAMEEPYELAQPFTVVFTLYIPAELTVIDGVIAPVDHNKAPGTVVDNIELEQLFTTFTKGVAGALLANSEPFW